MKRVIHFIQYSGRITPCGIVLRDTIVNTTRDPELVECKACRVTNWYKEALRIYNKRQNSKRKKLEEQIALFRLLGGR